MRRDTPRRARGAYYALLALLLAGAALRFATLDVQSLWFDEAATGHLMRLGFGGMLSGVPRTESTPPLFYVLEWLWTRPFGTGAVALRSLSALLGTATIAVVFDAARRIRGARVGVAGAAFVAFNPLLIWYSQEARSYALLVVLVAVGLCALVEAERGHNRAIALWAGAGALAVATHYFALFVVVPEAAWLLWRLGRRRALLVGLGGLAVVTAALAPLALHQRAQGSAHFIAQTALGTRLVAIAKQFVVGYDAPGQIAIVVVAGACVVVALALLACRRDRAVMALCALAATAVALPLALAIVGSDYLITRNVIAALVPAGVALAIVLARSPKGWAALVALCAAGLAAVVGVAADVHYQRDDWRDAARTIPRDGRVAVVVIPASGADVLAYYRRSLQPFRGSGMPRTVEVISMGTRVAGARIDAPRKPAVTPTVVGYGPARITRHATFLEIRFQRVGTAAPITAATIAGLGPALGSTWAILASN